MRSFYSKSFLYDSKILAVFIVSEWNKRRKKVSDLAKKQDRFYKFIQYHSVSFPKDYRLTCALLIGQWA